MPSSAGMEAADGAGAVVALRAADPGFARAWLDSAVVVAGGGVTGVAGADVSGAGDVAAGLGCTVTAGGVGGSVAGGEGSADGVRVCGADDASGGPFGADCGFSAMIP